MFHRHALLYPRSLALLACSLVWPLSWPVHAAAESAIITDAGPPTAQPAGVVNLNAANAEELERLPSVGPTRARAILELRARITRFTRLEELMRVKGIGRATFRKLRPWLTLTGPTTLLGQAHVTRSH